MTTKDRNERYSNATDLLEDLESVARGERPVHAHEKCDEGILRGLSKGVRSEANIKGRRPQQASAYPDQGWPITLSIGLGVSVVLNIILLIMLLANS
jgi:hypothetical protein